MIITRDTLVFEKKLIWSMFVDGTGIPMCYQAVLNRILGKTLARGDRQSIKLLFMGQEFDAYIQNLNNPRSKRKNDAWQLRYHTNGPFAQAMRACFPKAYKVLYDSKLLKSKVGADYKFYEKPVPNDYIAIYATEFKSIFLVEPIFSKDIETSNIEIKKIDEIAWETQNDFAVRDANASVVYSDSLKKVRRLDRSIGENLKILYDYRCQICGQYVGLEYGAHIAEAHHIDFFSRSLNNDYDNQIILCPNHHRIIHAAEPAFDKQRLLYVYKNGIEQPLVLNKHLGRA